MIRGGAVADQQAGFDVLGTLKSARGGEGALVVLRRARRRQASAARPTRSGRRDAGQWRGVARGEARGVSEVEGAPTPRRSRSATRCCRAAAPARAATLFVEHPAAQCTRCHTVRNAGSDVGPNLTGVATRLTRDQILESLLEPSARIAPGYGTVGVTLKNGQRVDGTLKEETATEVVISAGTPPAEQRIAKTEIAERTNPVSAMPPMGVILKPREVRDVVAYLRRCGEALRGYEGTGSTRRTEFRRRHEEIVLSSERRSGTARARGRTRTMRRPHVEFFLTVLRLLNPTPAYGRRASVKCSWCRLRDFVLRVEPVVSISSTNLSYCRSTTVGSIRAARRAGSHPASSPTAEQKAAPMNVAGSRGSRP